MDKVKVHYKPSYMSYIYVVISCTVGYLLHVKTLWICCGRPTFVNSLYISFRFVARHVVNQGLQQIHNKSDYVEFGHYMVIIGKIYHSI